jgi:uncharacterized delta-60 repeat protein
MRNVNEPLIIKNTMKKYLINLRLVSVIFILIVFDLPKSAFSQAGSLDSTFGTNGKVRTLVSPWGNYVSSLAIQNDGKLVTLGINYPGLVRYNTDGTLDSTFGMNGIANAQGKGLTIQSDGKILVAFTSGLDYSIRLTRFNTNGSLDSTFGINVTATTPTYFVDDGKSFSVAIQTDGKAVVACTGPGTSGYSEFIVVRYNTDGTIDSTFGSDGIILTGFGSYDGGPNSIAIQNDGKLVVTGYSGPEFNPYYTTVRYKINGDIDSTFGMNGKVFTPISTAGVAKFVAIQFDGKIVVKGVVDFAYVAVARYNTDGSLDSSFSADGIVTLGSDILSTGCMGNSLVFQSDGKIVLSFCTQFSGFGIARLNTNGNLDSTFGTGGGYVLTTFSGSNTHLSSIVIQADGKIVAAGDSYYATSDYEFVLARYNNDSGITNSIQLPFSNQPPQIKIMPNPFKNQLKVLGTQKGHIILFDISGKGVFQQETLDGETILNTETISPGFYLLHYFDEKTSANIKMIKQ